MARKPKLFQETSQSTCRSLQWWFETGASHVNVLTRRCSIIVLASFPWTNPDYSFVRLRLLLYVSSSVLIFFQYRSESCWLRAILVFGCVRRCSVCVARISCLAVFVNFRRCSTRLRKSCSAGSRISVGVRGRPRESFHIFPGYVCAWCLARKKMRMPFLMVRIVDHYSFIIQFWKYFDINYKNMQYE